MIITDWKAPSENNKMQLAKKKKETAVENVFYIMNLRWTVLTGILWYFRCGDMSSLLYFIQGDIQPNFLFSIGVVVTSFS